MRSARQGGDVRGVCFCCHVIFCLVWPCVGRGWVAKVKVGAWCLWSIFLHGPEVEGVAVAWQLDTPTGELRCRLSIIARSLCYRLRVVFNWRVGLAEARAAPVARPALIRGRIGPRSAGHGHWHCLAAWLTVSQRVRREYGWYSLMMMLMLMMTVALQLMRYDAACL